MKAWATQTQREQSALSFLFCGKRACAPGDAMGPVVRENHLLYFCISGRGEYRTQGQRYDIQAGEGFLVLPNEVAYYQADTEHPWSLIWVGFSGSQAEEYLEVCGLSQARPVFRCTSTGLLEHCVQEMMHYDTVGRGHELLLLGELYRFLGRIAMSNGTGGRKNREAASDYVELAVEYIYNHYQEDLTVAKLAKYVGLNRSYLTTVFQATMQCSPQQFLMRYRMERALQLLQAGELSVAEVAHSCGYPDPLTFSKAFKRTIGETPSYYRKKGRAERSMQTELE